MPKEGERLPRATDGTAIKLEGCALPPYTIVIQEGWNPRKFDNPSPAMQEADESLERSIRARIAQGLPGIFKAIQVKYVRSTANWRGESVKGGTPLLVDGERRLRIYRKLWDEGLKAKIPTIDTETGATEAQLRAATIIANDNFPLTPLEIGLQCKVLRDGCCQSVAWIAENIGKPVRFVTEAIALHNAPEEAKAMVAAGQVSPSAVRHELKAEIQKAKAEKRAPEPERIVEPLREAFRRAPAVPEPKQATLPGTPARKVKPPKPLPRPKKQSAREVLLKADMVTTAKLGIDLARHVIADDLTFPKLEAFAKKLLAAAGLKE